MARTILVGVGIAGGLVAGFARVALVLRRAAKSSRGILPSPGQAAEGKFAGGVMSRTLNATGELARLELFGWGLQVRGATLVTWLIPTWQARYQEIASAQLVAVRAASSSVRLQLCDGGDPVIFLTRQGAKILDQLEMRGVPVDREPRRLHWSTALDP